MPTKLIMPLLGEAVTDATVTKWLKAPGDKVEEYEPILEVNTDKVDTEIPSPSAGVILATMAKEGEVVKVGATLGWIGLPGEAIPTEGGPGQAVTGVTAAIPAAALPAQPAAQTTAPRELGFISPVVARIAAEQNVDLSKVPGTGMGGRITKRDIERFLELKNQAPATPAPTPDLAAMPLVTEKPVQAPAPAPSLAGAYTVVSQTPMRKVSRSIWC